MENKKLKIGFASNFYGTPKGHSYVIKQMVETLQEYGHKVYMYRIGTNEILPEFPVIDNIKSFPGNSIPKEDFIKWVKNLKLDWCIFNEYKQWWDEDHDKVSICKELGIKTMGYNVWEKLDWTKINHYKQYTKLMAPTRFQTKLMRKHDLYQTCYIPWGVNIKEMDAIEPPDKTDKIVFYHCAGSGGVGNRKNTKAVIEAYKKIKDENTELFITHLNAKIFKHSEILAFTKYADVIVNTSKWDTIGINTLEANACGKPVLVCNTEPMNELVKDHVNGLVVEGEETTCDQVTCPSFEVDIDDLANKMNICKNRIVLEALQKNSRTFAEINFNWENNKEHLLKMFQ